jgi:RNA polymerase sigma factor (sigma-70 family)
VASVERERGLHEPASRCRTYAELYEAYAPELRRRCHRLTRDPDAAEDLLQEVFVRFIARFPEPPADMNVAGYLHATARNVLWKQLRDDREIADADIERSAGSDDDLEIDPERSILLVEQQGLVQRCAAVLTGRQRRALTLRDVEGQSYAEIGADLGVGTDAVAQVISRARARLRVAVRRAHVDLDQLSPECRAMLGPLSDYLDGHAVHSSREIESHLAECEACRNTLAAFKGAGSRLRGTLPMAPLAGFLARIGEVVRLGGGGPADAVRAGALAVAAAVAIGGGGMYAATELTASQPSRASAAPVAAAISVQRASRVTPRTAPAALTARSEVAPQAVRGERAPAAAPRHVARHPRTPAHPKGTSKATPKAAATTPVVQPSAAPAERAPATTPAITPAVSKPAVELPVSVPRTPAVTAPVDAGSDVTRTAAKVAPVVSTVVDPVVNTVVAPAVTQAVAPVTKALAPVTDPVTKAVAPVTTAVAPVTAPVEKVVGDVLPPPSTQPATTAAAAPTPAATTPAVTTPEIATPVTTVPSLEIGLG